MTIAYLLCAVLLLLLNAFFVLAEFAAVKVRPSRIEELIARGNVRAKLVKTIQAHLDEYLSVCQVGITFASIGLGFVGEPGVVRVLEPMMHGLFGEVTPATLHTVAFTISYLLVSFLHILIGELVPKSIAIRAADRAALWTALPLRVFHVVFFVPLWLLNHSSNFLLRLIGLPPSAGDEHHSEDELRIILARSHSGGLMSFRRLLFMENVFDFGELRVRDAMRVRSNVKTLRSGVPWAVNAQVVREARFSRYPLVDAAGKPLGVIHIKDLYLHQDGQLVPELERIARPFLAATEDAVLETLLTEMQRRRIHAAVVTGKDGAWTGWITMEDIIEEIIGTVEDEFASEPPVYLADVLSPGRIVLGIEATTIEEALAQALARVPIDELPLPAAGISTAILERERLVSTYLGNGIAMPHARLPRLVKPVLIFARSESGIPVPGREEKMHLLFILLTPAGLPRIHQRLQARIAGILESDFIDNRLREAHEAGEILEAIRTGEQTSLD